MVSRLDVTQSRQFGTTPVSAYGMQPLEDSDVHALNRTLGHLAVGRQQNWREFDEAPTTYLPPGHQFYATQDHVEDSGVADKASQYNDFGEPDHPVRVLRTREGRDLIVDGHHTVAGGKVTDQHIPTKILHEGGQHRA